MLCESSGRFRGLKRVRSSHKMVVEIFRAVLHVDEVNIFVNEPAMFKHLHYKFALSAAQLRYHADFIFELSCSNRTNQAEDLWSEDLNVNKDFQIWVVTAAVLLFFI